MACMTPFESTPLARIDELIEAQERATPASPDDQDELAEITQGLKAIRTTRLAQVRARVRTYVFAALRRTVLETNLNSPDVPIADIKDIAREELAALMVDGDAPTLLDHVMDGSITE